MRNIILFSAIFLIGSFIANGQSKEEALNAKELTWLGLDFTHTKFVGAEGFTDAPELVNKYIPQWNALMLNERDKYNVKKYFRLKSVIEDFSIVDERNNKIDPSNIIIPYTTQDTVKISQADVQNIVSEYNLQGEGYAVVLIVESFNKTKLKATIWVTYIHEPTKQVVLAKKLSAPPMGFGLRNYWASSILKVMKASR